MWIVTRDGVNVAGTRDAGLLVHLEAELQAAGLPAVAIEVDGPQHYASNCAAPLGRTLVRDRLLQARGCGQASSPTFAACCTFCRPLGLLMRSPMSNVWPNTAARTTCVRCLCCRWS